MPPIVDERRNITLRLRMAVDTNGDVVEFFGDAEANDLISPVIARLYGQLLVKTGIPKEFEISNAIGGGQL